MATVKVCIMEVGPELAAKWLTGNTHNRNLRPSVVAKYAADMRAGEWKLTGEPVQFGSDGSLLNGQHRLTAIVESGRTVQLMVVTGLDPEVQERLDQGVPRQFSDVLNLRGESNPNLLAALTRKLHEYETAGMAAAFTSAGLRRAASTAELLGTLELHPELRPLVPRAGTTARHLVPAATTVGLLIWVFEALGDDAVDDTAFFFDRLCDGQNLMAGDAIYELRRTFEQYRNAPKRERISQAFLAAITIKAWNAYRTGKKISMLKWRQGGATPEGFPVPK